MLKRLERLEELTLKDGKLVVDTGNVEAPASEETLDLAVTLLQGIKATLDAINAKLPALEAGRVPVVNPTAPA